MRLRSLFSWFDRSGPSDPDAATQAQASTTSGSAASSYVQDIVAAVKASKNPPWHYVSEEIFSWFEAVEPCACQPIKSGILDPVNSKGSPFRMWFALVHSINKGDPFPCGCVAFKNYAGPFRSPVLDPALRPTPSPLLCQLAADYQWPFDLHLTEPITDPKLEGDWIEKCAGDWIAKRLTEVRTRCSLPPAQVEGPSRLSRWFTFGVGSEPESDTLGPAPTRLPRFIRDMSEPPREHWLKLKRYTPLSSGATVLDTSRRWLAFLYRRKEFDVRQFPPLGPLLGAMFDYPEFTTATARDLYRQFEDCDVDFYDNCTAPLLPPDGEAAGHYTPVEILERRPIKLRGINGVTVFYLACGVLGNGYASERLLADYDTATLILRDLAKHRLGWMLCHEQYFLRAGLSVFSFLRKGLNVASLNPEQLCILCSLWVQVLMTRALNHSAANSDRNYVAVLNDVCSLLRPLFRMSPSDFPMMIPVSSALELGSKPSGVLHTADLSMMGTLFGCAVGTLASHIMSTVEQRRRDCESHQRNTQLCFELGRNVMSILGYALKGGHPNIDTTETLASIRRHIEARMQGATDGDIRALNYMLNHVDACMRSVLKEYRSFVSAEHVLRHWVQAFLLTVSAPAPSEIVTRRNLQDWASGLQTESGLLPVVGERARYDADAGHLFFHDLIAVKLLHHLPDSLLALERSALHKLAQVVPLNVVQALEVKGWLSSNTASRNRLPSPLSTHGSDIWRKCLPPPPSPAQSASLVPIENGLGSKVAAPRTGSNLIRGILLGVLPTALLAIVLHYHLLSTPSPAMRPSVEPLETPETQHAWGAMA